MSKNLYPKNRNKLGSGKSSLGNIFVQQQKMRPGTQGSSGIMHKKDTQVTADEET